MHCYETRFGGKCAAEVTLPSANHKNTHCEEARSCQSQQLPCIEQPAGETGHHLRSRSHFWPQTGLVATTAEEQAPDSSSQPQPARTTRDAEDTASYLAAVPPARKKKRLTAEEKLIEDNKAYYKLEMKNNKLRSSGYFVTNRGSFEMGHAFVKEAEVSPANITKQLSGFVNKSSYDHKHNHKISNDGGVKDSQGEDLERSRLRSFRSDCGNSFDNSVPENSINNKDSANVDSDHGRNSSADPKANAHHKCTSDSKGANRKNVEYGKEATAAEKLAPVEFKEVEEKNDGTNKQACNESEEQHEAKTESSGSGTNRTRIRLSELSLLSNEAENFMFGEPVKKISSDESSDEECIPLKLKIVKKCHVGEARAKWKTKRTVGRKKQRRIYKKVHRKVKVSAGRSGIRITSRNGKRDLPSVQQFDDSSAGSADACSLGSNSDANTLSRRQRKRRTHAEAFIHDNLDYYKFEIPGSRLRFQGSMLPQVSVNETQGSETENSYNKKLTESSHTCDSNKENSVNSSDSQLIQFNAKSLETIRKSLSEKLSAETDSLLKTGSEAVVDTNIKKEDSNDKKISNDLVTKDITLDGLRFSFEVVPQCEPWYQTYQRQDTGNEIYLSCPIDTSYWKSFLLPYEMTPTELAAATANSSFPSCSKSPDTPVLLRKKKNRFAHLMDKKPRKSPRCHASTLAILSGLMHFRKRKDPDKLKTEVTTVKYDSPNSEDDERHKDNQLSVSFSGELSSIEGTSELKKDFKELAQNIDEMLASFPESNDSCIPISSRNTDDAIEVKSRTSRSNRTIFKKHSKTQREKFSKKLQHLTLKDDDLIDIDQSVLESLATMSKDTADCFPKPEAHNRGGPMMDVVSLLDSFSDCHCAAASLSSKRCLRCGMDSLSPALREMSCNSSECGASSTCDTITYSDGPEGRQGFRAKRRKRKKNRTGWPIDKQKFKKRFYLRFKKGNENIPVRGTKAVCKSDSGKHLHVTTETDVPLNASINEVCSDSLCVDTDMQKYPERSSPGKDENIRHSGPVGRIEGEDAFKASTPSQDIVSKDGVVSGVIVASESSRTDKKVDKDTFGNVPVTFTMRPEKHNRLLRTGSLDSSTRSELKPCVKVKKIPNLAEYQIIPTIKIGISNRRLRSASSSSLTSTPVTKMDFAEDNLKDETLTNRRSCRKKRPKFGDNWDAWLTPNRR